MPSVLIVSDDEDFYPVLAEQLDKQLAFASRQVDSQTQAKQKLEGHALLVSDQPLSPSDWPCPVILAEKPVRLYDLLAQIASIVHKASFPEIMDIGQGCQLHSRLKQLVHGPSGKMVDVTDKEIQLLKALMDGGDNGVGRDSLLKTVWGFDSDVDTHTLETHIYRLRGKLKDACDSDGMIEAFDGGYKMVK
jgi:CheY-like chemotaxis protein